VLNGAAARFRHTHSNLRFQRVRARRHFLEIDGETCFALRIGRRQIGERLLHRLELFVGQAELIAGKAAPLFRRRDGDLPFQVKLGGGGAVEEASRYLGFGRVLRRDVSGGRGQVELDPVRHIIFDQETRLADRAGAR